MQHLTMMQRSTAAALLSRRRMLSVGSMFARRAAASEGSHARDEAKAMLRKRRERLEREGKLDSTAASNSKQHTGVTVDVLGQSGKMTLSNGPNQVTVAMDNLYELDAGGNIIGNTGPNAGKHSRQTFASVDFSINTTPRRTSRFGVPADGIDFSTTLLGSSQLEVTTFTFLHNGVIHPTANESWTVAGGTIKFSIDINSWPFCSGESGNPCQGATGAYHDCRLGGGGVAATW